MAIKSFKRSGIRTAQSYRSFLADNTKFNPILTPLNTVGLSVYLDAGDPASYPGSGSTWFDLSTNGRNFTWINSPSYNSSGIKYFNTNGNGANGPASNSFGIDNNSGYTIHLVLNQFSTAGTGAFKFYRANAGSSSGRGIFSHLTWVNNDVYWDQGGCCDSNTRTYVSGMFSNNTWVVVTFRRNGTDRRIYRNSDLLTTNSTGAATLDLDSRAMNLGYTDEYGTDWNAGLASFAVYNRGLTDAELTSNINALKQRYGIT